MGGHGTCTPQSNTARCSRNVYDPNPLGNLIDDGHYLPTIKRHSLEKIKAHNHNVQIFATATKARWPQRAYLGLYSGAGRARLDDTGEVIETTAMSVFRLPNPFTHHIFVDRETQCTTALDARIRAISPNAGVNILTGDVNDIVQSVQDALPRYSRDQGLLSYCFVDPFDAGLSFATMKALGRFRMDFLVVLMLGNDARRNFKKYLEDEQDTRIARLVDAPDWREEWRQQALRGRPNLIRFLLTKFDQAMVRLGYRPAPTELAFPVKAYGMNVLLYQVVFYSKHELGERFWRETRKGITSQQDMFE